MCAHTFAALTTHLICSEVCIARPPCCKERHVLFISATPGGRPLLNQGCRRIWVTLMRMSGSAVHINPARKLRVDRSRELGWCCADVQIHDNDYQ